MTYYNPTTTDNYIEYKLGEICNLTLTNDDAANGIAFSSNGSVADLTVLYAGESQTFRNINIVSLFAKSLINGNPAKFRISGW